MSKQREKSEVEQFDVLVRDCESSYAQWEAIYGYGCNDPFTEDGTNLNLVRNHIIYFKPEIEKFCESLAREPPPVLGRELPPEIPDDYMACADEIRVRAKAMLKRLKEYADYKELCACRRTLSPQQRKECHIDAVLAIVPKLEHAVEEDSLVDLRRYGRQEMAFESITEKLAEAIALPGEEFQLSLYDAV